MLEKKPFRGTLQKSPNRWFVVATKPRRELFARTNLLKQGYEVFFPSVRLRKRYQNKWQMMVEPMFPGYLFLTLIQGEDDFSPIRSTLGCIGLVRFGPSPAPVPNNVIQPLLELGDTPLDISSSMKPGDKVKFEAGPFQGAEAIYDLSRGDDRAQVLLKVLGRNSFVTVHPDQLSKFD